MWPFSTSAKRSAVLIHIGSSSVGGAYVQYEVGTPATILFTVRAEIEVRKGEDIQAAMLRALDAVGSELIEKGAPVLRRETGSGRAEQVLVSVSAPWQETSVRTESINPGKPFIVTKQILSEAISSHSQTAENRVNVGDSVIATILNGYDIPNPIGKKVQRAEIVILSSTLDTSVVEEIRKRIRAIYHTHTITLTAFAPVAYSVLRDSYPHERDFLVLDVSGEGTALAFVKGGLLVDVGIVQGGMRTLLDSTHTAGRMTMDEEQGLMRPASTQPGYISAEKNAPSSKRTSAARDSWLNGLVELIKQFAQLHALPRTLFLLTEPNAREQVRNSLNNPILRELWLADEPLSIIAVTPEQFSSKIHVQGEAHGDTFLAILALYQQKQLGS